MKTLTTLLLIGTVATLSWAQDEIPAFDEYDPHGEAFEEPMMEAPPMDGPHHEGMMQPPPMDSFDGPPGQEGPHGRRQGQGGDPVRRWMEHLRERDPAEYERLQQLRHEDPRAFHEELRERLEQMRAERQKHGRNEFVKDFKDMPQDERDQTVKKLYRERTRQAQERALVQKNPEIRRLEIKSRKLAKTYQATTDQTEKDQIRTELKTVLNELFDIRSAERHKAVEQLEKKLTKLEKKLVEREANRDAIIERRLQDLTEGENLDW